MNNSLSNTATKLAVISFLFSKLVWGSNAYAAEIIKPNDYGYWVVDGFGVSTEMKCNISRSNFFPEKNCSKPSVVINRIYNNEQKSLTYNSLYFKLVAGDLELGDKAEFDGNNDPQRKVPLSEITLGNVHSEELFELLMSKPDSFPIKFMTTAGNDLPIESKVIILSGFKAYTLEQINEINIQYTNQANEDKRNLIFALSLLAVFLGIVIALIRFLIKKARHKVNDLKNHIDTRRVSRVAEDEAVREVVRKSVQSVDDESLEVLRNQIKTALDSGDTKTAEELLKILNGLTKK